VDRLADEQSAAALLGELGAGGVELDETGLARLRELRDALVALADRGRHDAGAAEAWTVVNRIADRTPMAVRFVSDGACGVHPVGAGVDAVVGRLVADLHAAVTTGRWARVRLCAHEPCSVAFYDATRSRTQRWHSYAVCGNRANVAAYRRRGGGTEARKPAA
jgi:predicted RNA-binding Zn ribbon-like protein